MQDSVDKPLNKIDINSISIKNIKMLSFELFNNILIVDLIKPKTVNGLNTKKIRIESTYEEFSKKLREFNKYKGLI